MIAGMRRIARLAGLLAAALVLGGCGGEDLAVEEWSNHAVMRWNLPDNFEGYGLSGTLGVDEATGCLVIDLDHPLSVGTDRAIIVVPRSVDIEINSDGSISGEFGTVAVGDAIELGGGVTNEDRDDRCGSGPTWLAYTSDGEWRSP